ncbi:DUF5329 domain-containing protein [Pseudomonas fluorescens]|uniref:DUF5329 domain-containing protein n=1 Tax=Pseudomonas fluorescens TaxID=294 RepID=A0A5E6UIT6_PSEFL|nr:DUF5329 domain-containing protein [Pseudomonas fluorescens]VVN05217.1 hypothetical protein PS624_03538 [Pseudomonas fluorescens]VVQ35127.1 hypothetical protein PS947_04390 [Pseudomonas fluorescens]
MRGTARHFSLLLVVAGSGLIAIVPDAQGQASPQVTQEIQALLDFVEHSECQFVRNGREYPGPRARAHLQQKLDYLEGRNRVNSAEDFIDLAATESSMTGRAYEVRCRERAEPASNWLKRELQRQRQLH